MLTGMSTSKARIKITGTRLQQCNRSRTLSCAPPKHLSTHRPYPEVLYGTRIKGCGLVYLTQVISRELHIGGMFLVWLADVSQNTLKVRGKKESIIF